MTNRYTESVVFLMRAGGLWMDYSGEKFGTAKKLFQISRICFIFGIWYSAVIKLYSKGMKFLLHPSSTFLPIGFCVVCIAVITAFNFPKVKSTIDEFQTILSQHEAKWEHEILDKEFQKTSFIINTQIKGLVAFAALYIISPVIIDHIRKFWGFKDPYKVPLPLDGYLEEHMERNYSFYLILLGSHLWFASIVSNYISFQGLVLNLVVFANIELKVMRKKIKSLIVVDGSWVGSIEPIIMTHQSIIHVINKQKLWLGLPLALQNSISTVSMCMVLYLLKQAVKNGDQVLIILCGSFLILLVSIILLYCALGQYLQSESELLFYAICDLPWYRLKPVLRKDLILMIMQARRLLAIDYKGQVPMNFHTFMQFMNTSYSYFMLMRSFED